MGRSVVYTQINQLMSLKGAHLKKARNTQEKDLGVIKNAAMVVENGTIQWVGREKLLPTKYSGEKKISLDGKNLFPGLVDCHTHLIFAGDRKDEFEMRNSGMTYQEIAAKGGGILSTMAATRKASLDMLIDLGQTRVNRHLQQGVTTIEVKSGYGLNTKTESKMLEAARRLKKANVVTTFLGAHAIPKSFKGEKEYLGQLKKDLVLVKEKGLSDRVDIFIEKNYFSYKNSKDYLKFAQSLGFDVCIHADQLSRSKATSLAVDLGAQSADHVICLSDKDKTYIAQSDTVAVLLPCADFYLQCDYPDARALIDRGACVAIATDFNPGSSPTQNISMLGVLSRLEMKMTLPEVFVAMTLGGAHALNRGHAVGALLPGFQADFFTSDFTWKDFFYDLSPMPVSSTFVKGRKVSTGLH